MNIVRDYINYPFAVNLDRCVRSRNILNDLSNRECVPNKKEHLNPSLFNMVTGIDQSKTLTRDISCRCKCKFDGKKCNLNQKWNNNKCWRECKNPTEYHVCKKIIFEILLHVVTKMVNMWEVLLPTQ